MKIGKLETLKPKGSDGKYFTTKRKGEIFELKQELHHVKESHRLKALKKVIASFTVGKDVSSLFSDVVICSQTTNVEMKKLVYFYVMNHAVKNQELTLLSINSFLKDLSPRTNPLIHSLSLRTLSSICMALPELAPYLLAPLKLSLTNSDPYIRKAAALCVAKVCSSGKEIHDQCVDNGIIELLIDLVSDQNASVVGNALNALDVLKNSVSGLEVDTKLLTKLLSVLNIASEWTQVSLLDFLSSVITDDSKNQVFSKSVVSENIADRVLPRLQHSNAAVVTSATRLLLLLYRRLDIERKDRILKQIETALLSTFKLNSQPEQQYVILSCINSYVTSLKGKKRDSDCLFLNQVPSFYVSADDQHFIQKEKIALLVNLCTLDTDNEDIVEKVISELVLYGGTISDEEEDTLIKHSIHGLSLLCQTFAKRQHDGNFAVSKSLKALQTILETTTDSFVLNQCVLAVRDCIRLNLSGFAGKMELEAGVMRLVEVMCEKVAFDELQPAQIFIVGEYSGLIENSLILLVTFADELFTNMPSEKANSRILLLGAVLKYCSNFDTKFPATSRYTSVTHMITAMDNEKSDITYGPELMILLLNLSLDSFVTEERERAQFYMKTIIEKDLNQGEIKHLLKSSLPNSNSLNEDSVAEYEIGNLGLLSSIFHRKTQNFVQIRKPIETTSKEDDFIAFTSDNTTSPSQSSDQANTADSRLWNVLVDGDDLLGSDFGIKIESFFNKQRLMLKISNVSVSNGIEQLEAGLKGNPLGLALVDSKLDLGKVISVGASVVVEAGLCLRSEKVAGVLEAFELDIPLVFKSFDNGEVAECSLGVCLLDLVVDNGEVGKQEFVEMWQKLGETETKFSIEPSPRNEVEALLIEKKFVKIATRPTKDYFSMCVLSNGVKDTYVLLQIDFASPTEVSFAIRSPTSQLTLLASQIIVHQD